MGSAMMDPKLMSYKKVDTLGKSQIDLILQVYDGAIGSFKAARSHYDNQEWDPGYEQLQKSKRFVTHLYTTLDPEKGGEIAAGLGSLYVFVLNQIEVVQASKDLDGIDASLKILGNLREAWAGIKTQELESSREAKPAEATPTLAGGINTAG